MLEPFKTGTRVEMAPSLIPNTIYLSPCNMADTRNKMVSISKRALMFLWGDVKRGLIGRFMAYWNELLQEVQVTIHVS